ncbi:hypothetical protein SUGI_0498730 [Cryptomeria japonica]|uniref:vicilin Pin k 2.0101-like n=1 Tax=Cryptomeria japonica TaxID=3369 RepID=UPI002408DF61|nr:vicilin Pin k 2.0101-like [Cryptomeria japonica]GLJ26000.1 hypothetical protein SUGI_0498730 [Cryptomeria japonica]
MVPISLLVFSCVIISSSIVQSSTDADQYSPYEGRQGRYEEGDNPYVFDRERFRTISSSRAGEIKALPNFRQQSELFKGIEKYIITCIEMKPNSLLKPHCIDADWVLFVVEGSGHIAYVQQESNNLVQRRLEEGDVFVVPAGQLFYLINSGGRQVFRLANLLYNGATPGQYQPFYVAGVRNPESVFSALSREVLEAAFNSKEGVEQMLSGKEEQNPGAIIQLHPEELERITGAQSRESMPAGHEQNPFNILSHRPTFQNNYGKIIEVDEREHSQLGLLKVVVAATILESGSMLVPNYNTRATKFGIVINGEGILEMACPHLAGGGGGRSYGGGGGGGQGQYEEGQQRDISYQKVRARLRPGIVFMVPRAHPYTTIASPGRPLLILCFEVTDHRNIRKFLTGKNNVLKELDKRVLGRSFGIHPEEMSRILESQKNEVIVRGPNQMGDNQGPMSF